MSRCYEIENWHNIMLPIMKQEKEEARIHLAEIKRVSEQIQDNSDTK